MLKPDTLALTIVLALLTALGPLSTDMYLPSLPAIAAGLGATTGQTQLTLSAFLLGFAAGQFFYGPISDRIGRKPIMGSTLILVGASTTLMGLTPTYAQIGIAAPLILVALPFLHGFSLGSESAAGPLLAMESAPGNTRGYFAALVSAGAAAGTVLGALAVFAVGALPREQLLSWGWRLPFLISAPIFAISFYVRMKVEESPVFQRAVQRAAPERVPLLAVLERHKVPTLQVLLCAMAESSRNTADSKLASPMAGTTRLQVHCDGYVQASAIPLSVFATRAEQSA